MPLPEFTLDHMLRNSVAADPSQIAVIDGERACTYAELDSAVAKLGGALLANGVKRGDRVGVLLEKSWNSVVSMFGINRAGAVFVNLSPLLKHDQITHIMSDCQVSALIADPGLLPGETLPRVETLFLAGEADSQVSWAEKTLSLEAATSAAAPETAINAKSSDLATIIYTSGSTGRPKGIMLTHTNAVAGSQIVNTYLENTPEDRVLCVLPFNFDAGLNQLLTMIRIGGTAVLQHSLLPGDILKNLREHRITGLAGVPPLWAVLQQLRRSLEREPLTELRYISNTGGMIPQTHLDRLVSMMPHTKIYLMYGLTEAFRSTYLPPEELHRGSACIGKAIPDTDVWVVTPEGKETAPGEPGELIHRGPTVALGYWGDPDKTAAVYRPNPFAPEGTLGRDMVVYSGDLVTRDEEGFMYFVGRRDEQIKTEGYRVSPQEVEDLLCASPFVHEAAVFGKKDPVLGHRIVAVVSSNGNADASAENIKAFVGEKAPHYMVPRDIHILTELPRTSSGKLDRSTLKREYAAEG